MKFLDDFTERRLDSRELVFLQRVQRGVPFDNYALFDRRHDRPYQPEELGGLCSLPQLFRFPLGGVDPVGNEHQPGRRYGFQGFDE